VWACLSHGTLVSLRHRRRRTVAFSGNFGSEIQIGNQQVLGKTWVKKLVINKFSLGKK
jgi:hypothetical protein